MATRPKGLRHSQSLPMSMSRRTLRPRDQIFRAKTYSRRAHQPTMKAASHIAVKAANPFLSPPSIRSISLGRAPQAEVETSETQIVESVPIINNFPSPISRPDTAIVSSVSSVGKSFKPSRSVKRLLLSTVPGFFGLMGLGHFYDKKPARGVIFLAAGVAISFLSSWYTILPERIIGFISGGSQLAPYSLSWMSYFTGYNVAGSEYGLMLLALVPAIWAFQVYDSILPIQIATRSIEMKSTLEVNRTTTPRVMLKTKQQVDEEVKEFAKDLTKTESLISYLWER